MLKMSQYGAVERPDQLSTAPTDDSLLNKKKVAGNSDETKVSGKAWGRVKNIFTRKKDYPYSVFFILGNEFCERFAYYGMRAILVLYLTNWLKFSEDNATSVFHAFVMLCYFSPLFGAIIADGYIGKYNTIFYVSMVYTVGSIVMAATAIPPPERVGPLIGLLLIGLGTGGIKPCVGPLGADQFRPEQEKERNTFFSAFYFMINLGSLISMLLTPVLRADVKCFDDSCYPLAFGVPAVLMIAATIVLVAGKSRYKLVPPSGNLIGRVFSCIMHGIKGKIKHRKDTEKRTHWLYYADTKYDMEFIEDVKILLKVLFMFIPLPLFWALFDQQGSRWTLQAEKMNGDLGVFGRLKPDQMSALNALLIITLIPLFEKIVYPCLDKCRIPNRPLQRMVAGMFLCAASFVLAAVLQMQIEALSQRPLVQNEAGFTIINTLSCDVEVQSEETLKIGPLEASSFQRVSAGQHTFTFSGSCIQAPKNSISKSYSLVGEEAYRIFVANSGSQTDLHMMLDRRKKPAHGNSLLSVFTLDSSLGNLSAIGLVPDSYKGHKIEVKGSKFTFSMMNGQKLIEIEPGKYKVFWTADLNTSSWESLNHTVNIGFGTVDTLYIADLQTSQVVIKLFTSVEENSISMLWQIPQYVTITVGEILYSITSLAFAYSQAPKSMKSVIQAALLMTTAFGSAIVIIVAQVQFFKTQIAEFLFFAGLMTVDTIIFMIMSAFYTYYYTSGHGNEIEDKTYLVNEEENEDIPLTENNVSPKHTKSSNVKLD